VSLDWLSPEAREELVGLVREVVRKERGAQEREEARRQWLTTEQVAKLVGTSDNAVRLRARRGWLAGEVARDGKRLLIRRSAILEWLDHRAER
jgi:excisionase family DNA binding protein